MTSVFGKKKMLYHVIDKETHRYFIMKKKNNQVVETIDNKFNFQILELKCEIWLKIYAINSKKFSFLEKQQWELRQLTPRFFAFLRFSWIYSTRKTGQSVLEA